MVYVHSFILILGLFTEYQLFQDVKEEKEDFAVCEPTQAHEGGSPEASEAIKRSSAEVSSETHQSTGNKRARVCSEVTLSSNKFPQ